MPAVRIRQNYRLMRPMWYRARHAASILVNVESNNSPLNLQNHDCVIKICRCVCVNEHGGCLCQSHIVSNVPKIRENMLNRIAGTHALARIHNQINSICIRLASLHESYFCFAHIELQWCIFGIVHSCVRYFVSIFGLIYLLRNSSVKCNGRKYETLAKYFGVNFPFKFHLHLIVKVFDSTEMLREYYGPKWQNDDGSFK